MDLIDFISSIAWPVSILLIASLYRGPVARLLAGERTSLRAGPFELAWENARPSLPRPGPVSAEPNPRPHMPASHLASALVDLARESPADAIVAAYDQLGRAFDRGLTETGVDVSVEDHDALTLARETQRMGVTGPEITDAVHGLSVLRNLAADGAEREVPEGRAHEFLAMADAVLYSIAAALAKQAAAGRAPSPTRESGRPRQAAS